jgi:hypothetical protein
MRLSTPRLFRINRYLALISDFTVYVYMSADVICGLLFNNLVCGSTQYSVLHGGFLFTNLVCGILCMSLWCKLIYYLVGEQDLFTTLL